MTVPSESTGRPTPPRLSDLFARYLKDQAEAQARGLGYPEPAGEVEPFEAVPVQPVDPALAWVDALAAADLLAPGAATQWQTPPDWPTLVAAQPPALALTFSLGNFPQLVRSLHPLLAGGDLSALRTGGGRVAPPPALLEWTRGVRDYPELLLAAGVLRLTGRFDEAADLLSRPAPAEQQAAQGNEAAALAWSRGRADEAAALWDAQAESVPVLFNRGMAALFRGDPAAAREPLRRAVEVLPETGAWHHLGRLYLALASARG
jgi:tetratricopeptide (TPR) repeat protein